MGVHRDLSPKRDAAQQVQDAIKGWLDQERMHTLVLGVSGGADSIAMAHALHACAAAYDLSLHIAHFDHMVRPTSGEDATFVADLATRWGLPFHSGRWDHGNRFPGGMEAAARKARYRFLADVARRVTPAGERPVVAVAHHQDDQAETVLLNLVRGAGYRGLTGMLHHGAMPEQGQGRRVTLFRPFLYLDRRTLREYAVFHGLAWREDATNAVPDRARTIIRLKVLPELERVRAGAAVALANFASADMLVHEQLERLRAMMLTVCLVEESLYERAVFSSEALRALRLDDRIGVVNQGLSQVFPNQWERGYEASHRLAAMVELPPRAGGVLRAGGPYPLVRGLAVTILAARKGEPLRLAVHRSELLPIEPRHPWLDECFRAGVSMLYLTGRDEFGWEGWTLTIEERTGWDGRTDDPWEVWLDADRAAALALTPPAPGMRFAPLGMEGHTRSLGDFFTDRKVAAALRPGWPLVVDAATGEVLWVCGLAISHHAAIQMETRRVWHLRWTRAGGL